MKWYRIFLFLLVVSKFFSPGSRGEAGYEKDSPYALRESLPDTGISVAGYDRLVSFGESVKGGRLCIASGGRFSLGRIYPGVPKGLV